MTTRHARSFNAQLNVFADVRAFVEQFGASARAAPRTISVLVLMLEELFTNTVRHGYSSVDSDSEDRHVWITLAAENGLIEACYEDAAPAHNPFARISAPDYSGPAEGWRVGGLGVLLVTHYADNLNYEHSDGRNRTRFTLAGAGADR